MTDYEVGDQVEIVEDHGMPIGTRATVTRVDEYDHNMPVAVKRNDTGDISWAYATEVRKVSSASTPVHYKITNNYNSDVTETNSIEFARGFVKAMTIAGFGAHVVSIETIEKEVEL